jgi:hypothetical protein
MREKVRDRRLSFLAKRVKAKIVLSSFVKAIGPPKPILNSQPSKEYNFWRLPSFPNHLVHARMRGPKKLRIIG